mmetsp:Transcript_20224/g.51508  ORF Transcript_20224/g.51508 Transcript_20224/m.51508 type:complete len:87 (-) Transcript_20224:837-1097(-)
MTVPVRRTCESDGTCAPRMCILPARLISTVSLVRLSVRASLGRTVAAGPVTHLAEGRTQWLLRLAYDFGYCPHHATRRSGYHAGAR